MAVYSLPGPFGAAAAEILGYDLCYFRIGGYNECAYLYGLIMKPIQGKGAGEGKDGGIYYHFEVIEKQTGCKYKDCHDDYYLANAEIWSFLGKIHAQDIESAAGASFPEDHACAEA